MKSEKLKHGPESKTSEQDALYKPLFTVSAMLNMHG